MGPLILGAELFVHSLLAYFHPECRRVELNGDIDRLSQQQPLHECVAAYSERLTPAGCVKEGSD